MIVPEFDESTALLAVFDGHGGQHVYTRGCVSGGSYETR